MKEIHFSPIDTWFFKEARPMGGFGGSEFSSTFPPPVRTLLGALRTYAGDFHGVKWSAYPQEYPKLKEIMGDAHSLGKLRCGGVFPLLGKKRLYPTPLHLVFLGEGENCTFSIMEIGEAIECDLGKVCLPTLPKTPKDEPRYKSVAELKSWIKEEDLLEILSGNIPNNLKLIDEKELFANESRVGIARDNEKRVVKESMLYQTRHIRLKEDVKVSFSLVGLEELNLPENGVCRLGGEGRGAFFEIKTQTPLRLPQKPKDAPRGVIVVLLTQALLDPKAPFGEVYKISSACVGKALREGGYDVKNNSSRTAQSYVPAGSVWFVELGANEAEAFVQQWHGKQLGDEQELGRGLIACGYWKK